MTQHPTNETVPKKSAVRRSSALIWRWTKRVLLLIVGLLTFYVLLILIGLIPVNRDFEETSNGVEIFVFSGAFHSDLILPIENSVIDWRTNFVPDDFPASAPWATHMAFGWGDKGFYINTPTWADLKFSTACNALLIPSSTVMHVSHSSQPSTDEETRCVRISVEQYRELVDYINESFNAGAAGEFQLIEGVSYGSTDAFYRGAGRYHAFRTCNCWVGQGLQRAGIKTGWFTPLPKTVFFYFPE